MKGPVGLKEVFIWAPTDTNNFQGPTLKSQNNCSFKFKYRKLIRMADR